MSISIGGVIAFLLIIVVLLVVLYVAKLVVDYLGLPDPIRKIVLLIVALIGLLVLIFAVMQVLGIGGGVTFH